MAKLGRKSWPGSIAELPSGPLYVALRSAIAECGQATYALAKSAGLDSLAVRKVVRGEGDIALSSAEKLFGVLGLAILRGRGLPIEGLPETLSHALRASMVEANLTPHAIGKKSGVAPMHVSRFIGARGDITLTTADRIARALELEVVRFGPITKGETSPGPLSDALRGAIAQRGIDALELSKASGTDRERLGRFIEGKGDLRLISVDKLFRTLSLAVVRDLGDGDGRPMSPSEAVRSAIVESGLSYFELARRSGAHSVGMGIFARGEGDIMLATADGISRALGLKTVRDTELRQIEPKLPVEDPMRTIAEALRSEIATNGLGCNALAVRAGISRPVVSRFLNRKRSIDYPTAVKLAKALGLDLWPLSFATPTAKAASPRASSGDSKPARVAASGADQLSIELGKLTEKQRKVVRAIIESEPEGLIGDAIRAVSGVPGYWKMLRKLKESSPFWGPRIDFPGDRPIPGKSRYHIWVI